jgi:hypothetical protein
VRRVILKASNIEGWGEETQEILRMVLLEGGEIDGCESGQETFWKVRRLRVVILEALE